MFIRKSFLLISSLIVLILVFFLHNQNSTPPLSKQNTLKIVTSFTILRDFAEKITHGLTHIEIKSIVPPEADPHSYQPTPLDSKTLFEADVIFINGLDFEKGIEKMIQSSGFKGNVYKATQHVKIRPDLVDPHTWHDVQNAILYVIELRDALCLEDSKNKDIYQKNAADLIKSLESLDLWIKNQFKKIPEQKRIVVTTHDAFWYFGKAYHIQFLSPVGISTEAEASAQNVAKLINFINEHNIKAVFVENLANSKLIEQIAAETKRSLQGTLYADSLSVSDGPAPDFALMIKHNVHTICKAFEQ
ncbi:MAG: zinc ABC transporter substrate-binding protein [Alphaproteobacteria bacterium]|nr:zinc ABC transporter substrate-binding protein [Alphaproteobacteria bacterium]